MTKFGSRLGCLGALALVLGSARAEAVIVVDGEIVPAWPDDPVLGTENGPALMTVNTGLYPHPKGTVYGLTLLVDFSDQAPAFTKAEVEAWLNEEGYSKFGLNGSVRDYFSDNSNGLVDFQNEVFGFYRAKQPKSYYEGGNGYARSGELFDEMMDYFDGSVDFSKYDNDGDGRTDAVSIVYAGDAEVWGQGLWPHASGSNEKRDGVTISRYQMTNLGESFGLYTFSHEVGHMLFGWPDLYGFGNYCIMGNGSSQTNPVGINDLYRADQEWIPIVDVDRDTNAEYSAKPNDAGYRFTNPDDPGESFFWSNVQSSGRFASISGDGLLLLHFDKGLNDNDPPNPLSLAVVQADGKKDLDQVMWPEPGSDPADYFHAGGVDEFSEASFATAQFNDGTSSGLRIYDIGPISESMSFKVGTGEIVVVPGTGGTGGSAGAGGIPGGGASGTAGSGMTSAGAGGAPSSAGGAAGSSAAGGGAGGASGSASGASGTGEPGAAPTGAPISEEGCACRYAGRRSDGVAWVLGLAGGVVLFRRRGRARP